MVKMVSLKLTRVQVTGGEGSFPSILYICHAGFL